MYPYSPPEAARSFFMFVLYCTSSGHRPDDVQYSTNIALFVSYAAKRLQLSTYN